MCQSFKVLELDPKCYLDLNPAENLGPLDIALSAEQFERLEPAGHCLNDEPV